MSITAAQRRAVILRAGGCCEYCRLTEIDDIAPFHIDHQKISAEAPEFIRGEEAQNAHVQLAEDVI